MLRMPHPPSVFTIPHPALRQTSFFEEKRLSRGPGSYRRRQPRRTNSRQHSSHNGRVYISITQCHMSLHASFPPRRDHCSTTLRCQWLCHELIRRTNHGGVANPIASLARLIALLPLNLPHGPIHDKVHDAERIHNSIPPTLLSAEESSTPRNSLGRV
jgi:hypothetical protein